MKDGLKELSSEFLQRRRILMAYIYGLVRDPHVAEDVFQDVWIRLANATEQGTSVGDMMSWCRGVAKNLILHHWREKRNAKVIVDSEILDLSEQAFQESEISVAGLSSYSDALVECVGSLPKKMKRMLSLKYEEGLSAAKIGEDLRQSAAAVLVVLSRIRRSLADCVERKTQAKEVLR